MQHFKRYWPVYLVTLLAILGGMWMLRSRAIGYYAQASALQACTHCIHVTPAHLHHLDYLGGVCDTYAVIVGLLFGFIWVAVLYINTYMSALYDTKPKPIPDTVGVMKRVLAATRQQPERGVVEVAGLIAEDAFADLVAAEMGAGFAQASSGGYLTS